MADIVKLIIPLSKVELTLEDLSEDVGFAGGYVGDINRPYLTQHLFLMYKVDLTSVNFTNRDYRFRNSILLHSRRVVYINKIPYVIYAFFLLGRTLLDILEGNVPHNNDEYLSIHKFWNFTDDFINELLCNRDLVYNIKDPSAILPEIDYMPEEGSDEYSLVKQKNPDSPM